jgi:hypothetical protein
VFWPLLHLEFVLLWSCVLECNSLFFTIHMVIDECSMQSCLLRLIVRTYVYLV